MEQKLRELMKETVSDTLRLEISANCYIIPFVYLQQKYKI